MADRYRVTERVRREPVESARLDFVMAIAALVVIVAVLIVTSIASAAPRSAPEPTAQLDVSLGASAPGPSGAPGTGVETPGAPRFRGLATWYCLSGSSACTRGYSGDDLVAAIDTDLGFGKGDRLLIRHGDRSVVVTVVDVCGCPGERLIDLTSGAFRRLANLDLGVIPVTVELAGADTTLPPTDEED
jgi:hypothetical protein